MNIEPPEDPNRPDPAAYTQPMTVVSPASAPVETSQAPLATPVATKPVSTKPVYAPTFGSLGPYAFTRFAALVIDFFVIPFFLACFAFNMADRGVLAFAPRSGAGFGTIAAIAFGVAIVFAVLFESIFETTLGKALFGLGVRRGTGQHAGLHRIVIRYVLLPIDLVVIGELLALVTRRHQRLGDFAAGTVVARHRIGGFITGLAILLFAGLIYAQATVGGGLTSVLTVATEGSYFGPALVGSLLADVGIGTRPDTPTAMPSLPATTNASSSDANPANAQNAQPTDTAPTDAPSTSTPQ